MLTRRYFVNLQANYVTVTWDAQGGTASESSRQVIKGQPIGALPTWSRDGYTFNGWFTAASDGSQINESTIVNDDVTYYAQFDAGLQSMIIKGSNFSNLMIERVGIYTGSWITLTNIPSDAKALKFKLIDTSGAELNGQAIVDFGDAASLVGFQYAAPYLLNMTDYNEIMSVGGKIGISCHDLGSSYTVQKIHTYVDDVLRGEDLISFNVYRDTSPQ